MYAAMFHPVESAWPSRAARIQQDEDKARRRSLDPDSAGRRTFCEAVNLTGSSLESPPAFVDRTCDDSLQCEQSSSRVLIYSGETYLEQKEWTG